MQNSILQELDIRIDRLRNAEGNQDMTDAERKCIQGRLLELESMKSFVYEVTLLNKQQKRRTSNHDFWRLVDEF